MFNFFNNPTIYTIECIIWTIKQLEITASLNVQDMNLKILQIYLFTFVQRQYTRQSSGM